MGRADGQAKESTLAGWVAVISLERDRERRDNEVIRLMIDTICSLYGHGRGLVR